LVRLSIPLFLQVNPGISIHLSFFINDYGSPLHFIEALIDAFQFDRDLIRVKAGRYIRDVSSILIAFCTANLFAIDFLRVDLRNTLYARGT
jgi:hypothetical protein